MKIGKVLTSLAAAGLLAAPVMAQAGTKASAAVSMPARTITTVSGKHKASATVVVVGVLAAAAVAGGIVAVADNNNNKSNGV